MLLIRISDLFEPGKALPDKKIVSVRKMPSQIH